MIIDHTAIRLARVVTRHIVPDTVAVSARVDEEGDCLRLRALRDGGNVEFVVPGDAIRECNTLGDLQRQITDAAKEARFKAKLAAVLGT